MRPQGPAPGGPSATGAPLFSQLGLSQGAFTSSEVGTDRHACILFAGLIAAAIFSGSAAAQQTVILTNATLIDGSGSPPQPNVTIVIERGRIAEIAPTPQGPSVTATTAGQTDGDRSHRQVRHARHHQRPRPCRTAGARSAVAAIRALRRDHDDQHVFRPGRRAAVQGAAEGRRPARRAHPHRDVPLHVGAVQTRLGEQDAGGRPRQGRRDRRQGRRLREGVDRRPGRPLSQAHAGVHRRRDGSGEEAQQDQDGAYRRARRRAAHGRSGRQHPRSQRARPGHSRRFHRHAEGEERLGDLDAGARGGAVRLRRRRRTGRRAPTIRSSRRA